MEKILDVLWGLGLSRPETPPSTALQSMITFEVDVDFELLLSPLESIGKAIAQATGARTPHQFKSLEYSVDPANVPILDAKVFRLERRQNEPFSLNRWFSFANATTSDHTKLLELIENTAKKAIS